MVERVRHKGLFVWRSTEASVSRGIPSVLATLEVMFSVLVYWAIAIYFETFTHIWVSVVVAPLLLLRCSESVKLGVSLFSTYARRNEELAHADVRGVCKTYEVWFGVVAALGASSLVSYAFVESWALKYDAWSAFWRSSVVGAVVLQFGLGVFAAFALPLAPEGPRERAMVSLGVVAAALWIVIATSVVLASILVALIGGSIVEVVVGIIIAGGLGASALAWVVVTYSRETAPVGPHVFLVPGPVLGIWIRSILIRFAATARFLRIGFWNIPENFYHALFVVDVCHPPEFIPGYVDEFGVLSVAGIRRRSHPSYTITFKVGNTMLLVMFLLPAYTYRFCIKSTCWLYLPLVYFTTKHEFRLGPGHFIARLWGGPVERLRRLLALVTVVGFLIASLARGALSAVSSPLSAKFISPFEYFFVIELPSVKPWQICALVSASVTLAIFLASGESRFDEQHARGRKGADILARKASLLKSLMRVRNIASGLLILIVAAHMILVSSHATLWLPPSVLRVLTAFYGAHMPSFP